MLTQNQLLNADDFWKINQGKPPANKRQELVNGKVIEYPVEESTQNLVKHTLELLTNFVRPRKLGQLAHNVGYYRPRDAHNVRVPDIAFISYERTLPLVKQGFIPYMPDLVVLVHPVGVSMVEIAERGLFFLKNGASMVWLLHPDTKAVDVCTRSPKKSFRVYKVPSNESLGGSDVLPGFSVDVKEIFAPQIPKSDAE